MVLNGDIQRLYWVLKVGVQNIYYLKQKEEIRYQKLFVYALERMGFGLNNLKILYNTIRELAGENKINYAAAIHKLFEFLGT